MPLSMLLELRRDLGPQVLERVGARFPHFDHAYDRDTGLARSDLVLDGTNDFTGRGSAQDPVLGRQFAELPRPG